MNSYNKKKLASCDFCEKGHNPNCGDEIEIELKLNKDTIEDIGFTGHGCAISQSSTSVMIDVLRGKKIEDAKQIIQIFIGMIKREITQKEQLDKLEDAIAFKNVSNMPARVKCALLAWHTMEDILNKTSKKEKVLLGMSGGVDSSVSALLLKQKGYDVIGITMELYAGSCCNINTNIDAKNVCKEFSIDHITYNLKDEFKEKVIDNFIDEYSKQRTPNPCIECNKYMKFGYMYEKAKELGCKYIATGHYAKVEYMEKYGRYVLKKAKNLKKDQSYVLYNIPKEMLENVIFPLGDFESKDEVRQIAKENNLKVANKPDSEDICFITDGNYRKFLEENSNLKPKEGNIVTLQGKVLGKHNGLYNYTIGQRKGLGISYKEPLFVIGFNKDKNEVIVGTQDELYKKEIYVNNVNLLLVDEIKEKMKVNVKTRYSSMEEPATIEMVDNGIIKVTFENKVARITPGQSAVFYIDDCVLGGGKIM